MATIGCINQNVYFLFCHWGINWLEAIGHVQVGLNSILRPLAHMPSPEWHDPCRRSVGPLGYQMISWNPFCLGGHKAPSSWMCPSETLWWECPFPLALFSRKCKANAKNHSIQQPKTSILPHPGLSCPHLSQAGLILSNTRPHLPASSQGCSMVTKSLKCWICIRRSPAISYSLPELSTAQTSQAPPVMSGLVVRILPVPKHFHSASVTAYTQSGANRAPRKM